MAADRETEGHSALERRLRMLVLAQQRGFVSVAELSERLGVSVVTVRSDLDVLAGEGSVQRVRGGAIPAAERVGERSLEEGLAAASDEKAAIGREAAASVSSGRASSSMWGPLRSPSPTPSSPATTCAM
ncbi:DeoR family transcriptional regulator [Rathayibacter oskolensis]|uniref:DeoR family transcriptional regulator n=1 Tax=Rathayibacter oskolensis TaxID=1891671 RepID=UPI00265F2B2C|nr:DeoR family transcriptional regulator [Rathayibacter oskolensis]WKK71966.1 DeoR family transcriptional regulator [Rathayibacter oskolensis]